MKSPAGQPSVICYSQPDKAKSQRVLEAFAAGCGARMASTEARELEPGPAAFYGVRPAWMHLWEQAKREGRHRWYLDNSYFDISRETYFRVTRNALQADGLNACWSGEGAARFKALGLPIRDWQRNGSHVVICPQSVEFMGGIGGFNGDWLALVTDELRKYTDRPFRIRKKGGCIPLIDDLRGAWALVTHMSCAAVEALLAGVPVFCTGRCSAQWMGTSDLSRIESPHYASGRQSWATVLAENQWTLAEMRDGTAWKALCGTAG